MNELPPNDVFVQIGQAFQGVALVAVGPLMAGPAVGPELAAPAVAPGLAGPAIGPELAAPAVAPGLAGPAIGPELAAPAVAPGLAGPAIGPELAAPAVAPGLGALAVAPDLGAVAPVLVAAAVDPDVAVPAVGPDVAVPAVAVPAVAPILADPALATTGVTLNNMNVPPNTVQNNMANEPNLFRRIAQDDITLGGPVKRQRLDTEEAVCSSFKKDDDFDIRTTKTMSYNQLYEKYIALQAKCAKMSLQLTSESNRGDAWFEAYHSAMKDMRSQFAEISKENGRVREAAVVLKSTADLMKDNMSGWVLTKNGLKVLIADKKSVLDSQGALGHVVDSFGPGSRFSFGRRSPDIQNQSLETVGGGFRQSPGTPAHSSNPPELSQSFPANSQVNKDVNIEIIERPIGEKKQITVYDLIVRFSSEKNFDIFEKMEKFGVKHNSDCQDPFNPDGDVAFSRQKFCRFSVFCKNQQNIKRIKEDTKILYSFWFWLGLTVDDLFGPNGLSSQGKLPTMASSFIVTNEGFNRRPVSTRAASTRAESTASSTPSKLMFAS